MQALTQSHWSELHFLLAKEAPCELVAHHPISTGFGQCWVDRWPEAQVAVLFAGGNLGFAGAAEALSPAALRDIVEALLEHWERIFIDPPEGFAPIVVAAFGRPMLWPRVLCDWPKGSSAPAPPLPDGYSIRAIRAGDSAALAGLGADTRWISDTFDGPNGLAPSGFAWAAFSGNSLAAVAASFYVGHEFEEIGVVTEAAHRNRGLSNACAAALIHEILRRGRLPCWATTPDNVASRRVAEKLGFRELRSAMQYMVGAPVTGALPFDESAALPLEESAALQGSVQPPRSE